MMECDARTPVAVEYRNVVGDLGYRVGYDGSVWTCLKQAGGTERGWIPGPRWRRKSPQKSNAGYLMVAIRNRLRLVHQLVLEAFIGPRPIGMVACHKDGDRRNNCVDNLRWDSRSANESDKMSHGTRALGERNGYSRLTDAKVRAIRSEYARGGISKTELGAKHGITRSTISLVVLRKSWKHVE